MSESRTASSAPRTLVASILALTLASLAYRLLIYSNLQHTSLVFIGIPALLALSLLWVQPKTTAGTVHKTVALALCMSGILFGEGFICIVMASPLFFLVGGVVARLRRSEPSLDDLEDNQSDMAANAKRLGIILIVPLSLEGVMPGIEMSRAEEVTLSRIVPASAEAVRASLAASPRFDAELPGFFRIGFPVPGATSGEGLAVGDRRSVQFLHGGHHPGTLHLEVTSSSARAVVFTAVADDSYISHWLSWRSAEVSWQETALGQTRVTWTLRYERRLDPAWYFAPLERYGVRKAADYLIESLATPRTRSAVSSHAASHPTEQ
jgi:hypothetical protein